MSIREWRRAVNSGKHEHFGAVVPVVWAGLAPPVNLLFACACGLPITAAGCVVSVLGGAVWALALSGMLRCHRLRAREDQDSAEGEEWRR